MRPSDRIEFGFVYGSVARGEEGPASDVDLMIVGQVSFREVIGALQRAQQQLAREVNPTVYSPREFRDRLSGRHPFLAAVMNAPRLMILGTDDELAGLVEERMAGQPRDFQERDHRSSHRDRTRSDQEAEEMINLAEMLRQNVVDWLQRNHPESL